MSKTLYEYEIKKGELVLKGGKIVSFNYPVRETLNFPEVIIVLLDVPPKANFNENVYGVSYDGKVLWQVSPYRHLGSDSPYTGINYESDKAGLYNWDSTLYVVEPETGQLINKRFVK